MKFWLGTHEPSWLAKANIPLFVSRRRLENRKTFPIATAPWALDSGAFTELSTYGKWLISCREYAALVRRFQSEIGNMIWAAPQDWMCEPIILAKTRASVFVHQRRTVRNYLALMEFASDVPWIPVLQGWTIDDYKRHFDLYQIHRVDLTSLPLVGVGTVCRRQSTAEGAAIISSLHALGLRVHGFGFKITGIAKVGHLLESCDSMAWSFDARRRSKWCSNGTHRNCANCIDYALYWRSRIVAGTPLCNMQNDLLAYQQKAGLLPRLPKDLQPGLQTISCFGQPTGTPSAIQ